MLMQAPESPINERWRWRTDVIRADNGQEQRVSTMSEPKRSWTGSFVFISNDEIRTHLATMFREYAGTFGFPLRHQAAKLKAAAPAGAITLSCNLSRTDLRVGQEAIVVERDTFEVVTVDALESGLVTLADPLTASFTARALIMPLCEVHASEGAAVGRAASNNTGGASFSLFADGFLAPFIADADKVALPEFEGYPVLDRRATGEEFEASLFTGLAVTDHGGLPSYRAPWASPKWGFGLTFLCQRGFDPADWMWWRTFADYCKGSTNPFYLPSWREDYTVVTPANPGGAQITVEGTRYSSTYHPILSFRGIAITREDGEVHYAKVTAVSQVDGNDLLTFAPALPAGSWPSQTVGMLLKCRISDDTVSVSHEAVYSLVTLNVRTID